MINMHMNPIEMALHDRDILRTIAWCIGLSVVADALY